MIIKNILKRILPLPAVNANRAEERILSSITVLMNKLNALEHEIQELKSTNNVSSPMTTEQKPEWQKNIEGNLSEILVRNGPFKGMRYPSFIATGSSLYPKLIGCYEKEIAPVIKRILKEDYEVIFDVGCAEGYYAVGIASYLKRNGRKLRIKAFDNNPEAQIMCKNMCIANNVEDIVEILDFCSPELLQTFNFGNKSLIISDCEGFERELFNEQNLLNLKNVDLLVEVHDWIQDEIPTLDYLKNLFKDSHEIQLIFGIDDYEKAYRYKYPELEAFTINERFEILRENRRRLGEWLFCKAKNNL